MFIYKVRKYLLRILFQPSSRLGGCIHMERTKPNSLNYAYFRDMVICFEYWDIFRFLCLYMSVYLFYSSRLYLILLGDMNRAVARRWYWMNELPIYEKVQIDSYRDCQNFVTKVQKKKKKKKLELKKIEKRKC